MYRIDETLCTGCGTCVQDCPQGAIVLVNGHAYISSDRCTMCGVCAETCPSGAIQWTDVVLPATIAGQSSAPQDAHSSRAPAPSLTPVGARGKSLPATTVDSGKQGGFWPMLGGALVWAGRQLLPEILALWRQNATQYQPSTRASPHVSAASTDLLQGGWRHRHRRHGGPSAR